MSEAEQRHARARSHLRIRVTRGVTLIEILLVAAIIASLIGMAVPFFGNIVQEARDLKTQRTLHETRKLLNLRSFSLQRQRPFVPGTPYSPVKDHRPEFATPVESLVPIHLSHRPLDAYGEAIYRIGNFLVSNGYDRLAGSIDDISLNVNAFAAETNPETGQQWSTVLEQEAYYQCGALALLTRRYMAAGNLSPTMIEEVYDINNQASPRDPWDHDYLLDPGTELIRSAGADGAYGTPDDITVAYGDSNRRTFKDDFAGGIHNWIKLFPASLIEGVGLRSTPAAYPPHLKAPPAFPPADREVLRLQGISGGVTGRHQAYFVRLPPATFPMTRSPRVQVKIKIWRQVATSRAVVGVFAGYLGQGTGYRAWIELNGSEVFASLSEGIPRRRGQHIAPAGLRMKKIGDGAPKDPEFNVTLSIIDASPPLVTLLVQGGGISNGSLSGGIQGGLGPAGFVGVYAHSKGGSSRFDADFDDFEVNQ